MADAAPAVETDAPTRTSRFHFEEHLWIWKASLRAFTIIICLIGVIIFAWAAAYKYSASYGDEYGDWLDGAVSGFYIIPLGLSIIFNFIVLLVLFLRKRPAHPGIAVGIDLILWLALLATGLLATGGAYTAYYWSSSYYGNGYDDNGYYDNGGSYVYNATLGYEVYVPDSSTETPCYPFDSCAQQAQVESAVMHRGVVEFVGVAMTFTALLLHFVLFVWACVDTHRRNGSTTQKKARVIADQIIAEMRDQGQLGGPQRAGAASQPLLARASDARDSPRISQHQGEAHDVIAPV
ncbi:hypothetical protein K490DRAFT_62999 [Saccharata proteae CBS 121410]|uniref:Uncharacterized protein n=1 Tax=Saccharata proteae CBS 121410 TaxID=1314787 RepID=A0A9P4HYA7_9PEZI|nr:hypothetical protein K490DRAFT_62999 [Saccharata proteae CBS 121410]